MYLYLLPFQGRAVGLYLRSGTERWVCLLAVQSVLYGVLISSFFSYTCALYLTKITAYKTIHIKTITPELDYCYIRINKAAMLCNCI